MTSKRTRFSHPRGVLLKLEEKELNLVDVRLQVERVTRPSLKRTEFLRELILTAVAPRESSLSDKPTPCHWCGRLQPEHRLTEHEENCGLNPKWKDRGKGPSSEVQELVQFRRWLEDRLTQVEDRLSARVNALEQLQFRGRIWGLLELEEQEKLLLLYLHPIVGSAPRQFRPVQFKEYLDRWGVGHETNNLQCKRDEVTLFLQGQVGKILAKNARGFYTRHL